MINSECCYTAQNSYDSARNKSDEKTKQIIDLYEQID